MQISAEYSERRFPGRTRTVRAPFEPTGQVAVVDLEADGGEAERQRMVSLAGPDGSPTALNVVTHVGGTVVEARPIRGDAIKHANLWVPTDRPGRYARLVNEAPTSTVPNRRPNFISLRRPRAGR